MLELSFQICDLSFQTLILLAENFHASGPGKVIFVAASLLARDTGTAIRSDTIALMKSRSDGSLGDQQFPLDCPPLSSWLGNSRRPLAQLFFAFS